MRSNLAAKYSPTTSSSGWVSGEDVPVSHPQLVEQTDRIEIQSRMGVGPRLLLAALALLPLLAPYELLIRTEWEPIASPFFVLAAMVSAGATALCLFLLFAALAGLSSRTVFDRRTRTVSHFSQTAFARPTREVVPWSNVHRIEVCIREWSDSAPNYYLAVTMKGGPRFETGTSGSREEIEWMRGQVQALMTTGNVSRT